MLATALLTLSVLLPIQDEDGKKKYTPKKGDEVKVQVCKTGLRKRPKTLMKPFHTVKMGTAMKVTAVQAAWIKVLVPKTKDQPNEYSGYVATETVMSAERYDVTQGQFNIDPDNPNTFVSSPDSGGAAAKGFTPEVEAKRRKDNAGLDRAYKQLEHVQSLFPGGKNRNINDRMIDQLLEFRKKGNLDK